MDTDLTTQQRIERERYGAVTVQIVLADGEAMVQIDLAGRRPTRLTDDRLGRLIDTLTAVRAARNEAASTIEAISDVTPVTL